MNKYQRGVLIGVGLIIAVIQLYGIGEYGLDESSGWPVSFLISAALLFLGLGSWQGFGAFLSRKPALPPTQNHRHESVREKVDSRPEKNKFNKHEFGIHISELDIAIEAHKNFAEKTSLFAPLEGNGKSLNWNCCASIYASMRYAARKTEMRIHAMIWNTIIHAIVVRMATEEIEGVGIGSPGYQQLEKDAYTDVDRINKAVEDALSGKGSYVIEPIVNVLAVMFGSTGTAVKALSAMIMLNAETAQKKILPELIADLS